MKSYVAIKQRPLDRLSEAWQLYANHTRSVPGKIEYLLSEARKAEQQIAGLLGRPVEGCKILEIGPGQQLVQLAYFASSNDVLGIDLDLVVQRLNLKSCASMFRHNGLVRGGKTVARKLTGIDRKMRRELAAQLGLSDIPELPVRRMDAARMDLPENGFEIVFSRAVFEHLADPAAVVAEIRRVLKPRGILYLLIHLYSSDSGCHDPRIFAGQRESLPHWSHLRPEYQHLVQPNSYLNRLRLEEWRTLFESEMPGSCVTPLRDAGALEQSELRKLRQANQLTDFSDDELLTVSLEVSWRKPGEDEK